MLELGKSLLGIGVDAMEQNSLQVGMRAVVVFFAAIIMVRLGDRRFLSRKTAFDAVLGFILASTLARAVNGSAPLIPTLVAGLVMVLLHRVVAKMAASSHRVGVWVKGRADLIIRDGAVVEPSARANHLSENDIMEGIRLNGVARIDKVTLGYLERNGEISVVQGNKRV